jgi:hypothetical protein
MMSKIDVGIKIVEAIKISIPLYADDIILMAESEQELQLLLNQLEIYCSQSQMQVNLSKTKILVFEKKSWRDQNQLN